MADDGAAGGAGQRLELQAAVRSAVGQQLQQQRLAGG
jgi:hypothetical protein